VYLEELVGITKLQVSTKMDEANVQFLDWLTKQGKPFPTSRSWWNNECISVIRLLFRSGEIGVPIASLQGIPGIPLGIPRIPQIPLQGGADYEPGLQLSQDHDSQARFNFSFSRLGHGQAEQERAWVVSSSLGSFRHTFACQPSRVRP
jgi:hypothetical protein